jgi:predicted DNA-binding ribbon-helix-helix protein
MPSRVQPRKIIINGHPTSIRLEPAFWGWLREIAAECGMTAKAFIEGVVAAKDPKCPLASALRLYIANYFRSSAPRYGLVDPASRLAFRIERPRRSRKGSKKTAVEIKPPVQDGINNPVVVRQDSNVQVISGKFLGDFQRHYDEKGYKIFDWVFETNPLAYFTALVGLSKIVGAQADVTHRDGSKPRSIDEILQKVEEQTGKEGRAAFEKFLAKVRPTE